MVNRSAAVLFILAVVFGSAMLVSCATDADQPAPANDGPSLYTRMGGEPTMFALAEGLLTATENQDVLDANPKLVAADASDDHKTHRRFIKEFLSRETGGPELYTGRRMPDAHAGLHINEDEWVVVRDRFVGLLTANGVGAPEHAEMMAIWDGFHEDVVISDEVRYPVGDDPDTESDTGNE